MGLTFCGVELIEQMFQDGDLAGWDGPGWYFWDETEAYCHGPFTTKSEAEAAKTKYAEQL